MINKFRGKYRFLSNFYPSKILVRYNKEGPLILYPTVEHAYQALKTKNITYRKFIAGALTPSEAKKFGRKVPLREDWEEIKIPVMEFLVTRKFADHKDLRDKLLATGNDRLIEGNTWGDTFWGVDIKTGLGYNHLGQILMEVRDRLK